jgi:hypothetical protein
VVCARCWHAAYALRARFTSDSAVITYTKIARYCVEPIKVVKGFNGQLEWGDLKSIPGWTSGWYSEIKHLAPRVCEFCY